MVVIIFYSFHTSGTRVILCLRMKFPYNSGVPHPQFTVPVVLGHGPLGNGPCKQWTSVWSSICVCETISPHHHCCCHPPPPLPVCWAGKVGDRWYNYSDIVFTYRVYGPQNHWTLTHKLVLENEPLPCVPQVIPKVRTARKRRACVTTFFLPFHPEVTEQRIHQNWYL